MQPTLVTQCVSIMLCSSVTDTEIIFPQCPHQYIKCILNRATHSNNMQLYLKLISAISCGNCWFWRLFNSLEVSGVVKLTV